MELRQIPRRWKLGRWLACRLWGKMSAFGCPYVSPQLPRCAPQPSPDSSPCPASFSPRSLASHLGLRPRSASPGTADTAHWPTFQGEGWLQTCFRSARLSVALWHVRVPWATESLTSRQPPGRLSIRLVFRQLDRALGLWFVPWPWNWENSWTPIEATETPWLFSGTCV